MVAAVNRNQSRSPTPTLPPPRSVLNVLVLKEVSVKPGAWQGKWQVVEISAQRQTIGCIVEMWRIAKLCCVWGSSKVDLPLLSERVSVFIQGVPYACDLGLVVFYLSVPSFCPVSTAQADSSRQ